MSIKRARYTVIIAVILFAVSGLMSLRVPINTDMTKYLPADSNMKHGMDILSEEFPGLSASNTIRVMFENVSEDKEQEILERFKGMEGVSSASFTGRTLAEGKQLTLFTISTDYEYRTKEELDLEHGIPAAFPEYSLVVKNDDTGGMEIPFFIFITAGVILFAVLFALCGSFAEPLLFLFTIGGAILLNMGTNLILGMVSQTTWSISAVLQLALSMDYSIILMNRYRQEKRMQGDIEPAMKQALKKAFPSIASSGFTTLVGLLMLVFMRFRIGRDIGLVLAKGVFLSMLCCLTVLPALILLFDGLIERTSKPILHIRTRALASFSYRFRKVLTVGFLVLFFAAWYLESQTGISYSLSPSDPIAAYFTPDNPVVILYDNGDEEQAALLARELEGVEGVSSVSAWSTTLGRQMTPEELVAYFQGMMDGGGSYGAMLESAGIELDLSSMQKLTGKLNGGTLRVLYGMIGTSRGEGTPETLSIEELIKYLQENRNNLLLKAAMGEEGAAMIDSMGTLVEFARSQLIGPRHSIMMISTSLPIESEETTTFIKKLETSFTEAAKEPFYMIGNSPMGYEMQKNFGKELLTISLLTAFSIFLVVLVTFRQIWIPAILVLLVQCGVFLTVATTRFLGYSMFYLALLIVQCILMGSTVDYGILFTNYYREMRQHFDAPRALRETYERSMHTILTSALFVIFATGAIGFSPADPTISQICRSLSIGELSATLLVIFVLPGILAALDRFVCRRKHG